jgi:photosystem II stability/assembly factor-like uncharacterized protein
MLRMIFLIVLFFLSTRLIFSQELNWKHLNGPMGGTIGDFAIAANGDIYAGVYWQGWGHEGLYHSSDNGDSWNKVPSPSPDYDFNVYEIYVTKKDHIWIGNADHPDILHRSTNNGETWEIKKNGYIGVECWAIGENKNGILFAGNADGFGGIFKSTDDGENWEFSGNVYPLIIATDSNNVTYAGTFSGLYSTSDNGLSWTKNSFFENITVSSIIIDD